MQRKWRGVGIPVIALMLAVLPGVALAQDEGRPSAAEVQAFKRCVTQAARRDRPQIACYGEVSGKCMSRPGGSSTMGMRFCLDREAAVWDELLNANYQKFRKTLEPKGVEALKGIQQAWIKWREVKCSLGYTLHEGGTLAGVDANDCVARTTALRAVELGQLIGEAGRNPLGMGR